MAQRIRGVYDERLDTPPSVLEYQKNKLASARVRWRAFKTFTIIASVTAGILAALDERLVTGHGTEYAREDHALAWIHRAKRAGLEAWALGESPWRAIADSLKFRESAFVRSSEQQPQTTSAENEERL